MQNDAKWLQDLRREVYVKKTGEDRYYHRKFEKDTWQDAILEVTRSRRYQGRLDSYRQNRLFGNNQRQFYRELDQEKERVDDDQPVAEDSKQFWGNIWSQSADHKNDAKWLQDL